MRVSLIEEKNVAQGGVAEVDFFGRPVLVLRPDDRLRAYVNVCTHLGGPLELTPDGEQLRCQWHGACFDARSGRATGAPARPETRLIRLPITVEAGQVTYVYAEPDQPADPAAEGEAAPGGAPAAAVPIH